MILFINACARKGSRTRQLAEHLLERLDGDRETVFLYDTDFPLCDEEFISKRSMLAAKGDFSDSIFRFARQFAAADEIVIAAPYWDLSFPSVLKQYIEQICVTGLTFFYNEKGMPQGLCRAQRLWYVTASGGRNVPYDFGYGYIKALSQGFFGIERTELVKAEGLEIYGENTKQIMADALKSIDNMDV